MAAVRRSRPAELLDRLRRLADRAEALAAAMDFRPLYRPDRHLFAIGFNLVQGRLDSACYDLLASECCLTSYLAVARGEAPRRHWFQLGRPFIRAAGRIGLISWGGTMFEYLMPRLLLRSLPGTLLAEACRTAVARQIEYGRSLGLPWGISESSLFRAVPRRRLPVPGLRRAGPGAQARARAGPVVAPYATAMATMLAPREALANFRRLAQEAPREYGFYEAIDYTPRSPAQGAALGRRPVVHGPPPGDEPGGPDQRPARRRDAAAVPRRAHGARRRPAAPGAAPARSQIVETSAAAPPVARADRGGSQERRRTPMSRRLTTPVTPVPRTHMLSNTQYHVMLTNAGSGSSTCRGLDVTRWREDATCEAWGQFCYIRDIAARPRLVGRLPAGLPAVAEMHEVIFAADKATFRRRDGDIETILEVIVSPEQRAEIRRITLINHGSAAARAGADQLCRGRAGSPRRRPGPPGIRQALPGDGMAARARRLALPAPDAICRRAADLGRARLGRGRSAPGSTTVGEMQYETDRLRFLGRGRTPANPAALDPGSVLSGTTGPVLDPVFCLRRQVRLEPGGSAVIALATGVAESRDEALALADQYREAAAASRAFELAWAHSQVEHRHGERTGENAHLFQRLASHILFAGSRPAGRPLGARPQPPGPGRPAGGSASRATGRSSWPGSPRADELPLVRQLLAAHAYLRLEGSRSTSSCSTRSRQATSSELNRQLLEMIRAAGSLRADRPARRRLRAQGGAR